MTSSACCQRPGPSPPQRMAGWGGWPTPLRVWGWARGRRRDIDSSNWHGKLLLTYIAQHDQYYADDISRRQSDSIRRRKERGITIGIYPFGTIRDPETRFLIPSPYGVWLASDGSHAIGVQSATAPAEGVIWRRYYEAAHEGLKLYATGLYRKGKIADKMNHDGWVFRNRYGQPHPF